ncbi:SDR family NAD(P)-dependent oxidoreductase [Salipiger sp.]|uniref:SDR family NAD(P)-dependent oxidoreductase n=1 Tax=Salipiger sp. TaxID=2078585 RepID=UPI003A97CF4B
MRLENKVAMITGGGAGIGLGCVQSFAAQGAQVVILDRDADRGAAALESLGDHRHYCLFVQTDVSEPESMRAAVDRAIARFGRIDVLYNNAGGSTARDGPVTEAPFEEFWAKMKVDLFGVWLGCHFVIPHMIAAGQGSVINATSVLGMVGTVGKDAYTAAKGGVIALTRSMALEFAPHGIRFNAIAPGVTGTRRILDRFEAVGTEGSIVTRSPMGLVALEDVANTVLFLATDECRKMTGQVLVVDAGFSAS